MANINPNESVSRTQKGLILQALMNGETLTPQTAIYRFGCTKLATRISELIAEGHTEIVKEWATVYNREYKAVKVMSYKINAA